MTKKSVAIEEKHKNKKNSESFKNIEVEDTEQYKDNDVIDTFGARS